MQNKDKSVHRCFCEDLECTSKFLMKEFAKFSFFQTGFARKRESSLSVAFSYM
jgi:hypothetical protein